MLTITDSMAWVYHDRGTVEPSLVRKYQEVFWNRWFGKFKAEDIVYELNTRLLPDGKQVILVNPNDPVEMIHRVRQLFKNSNYDIVLTVKSDKALSEMELAV